MPSRDRRNPSDLHRAIQTEVVRDIDKPSGAWKREPDGTYAETADGRQTFIESADPQDVPELMSQWCVELNGLSRGGLSE